MHWIHLFTLCGKGGERRGRLISAEADHPAVLLVGLNDCLPIPEGGHGIGRVALLTAENGNGNRCQRQWLLVNQMAILSAIACAVGVVNINCELLPSWWPCLG